MKKFLSIAALALAGALMTSCGTDDDIIENAPQTASEQTAGRENTVIVKLTVNRGAQTKALTSEGVKTFAVNDQIFLEYQNTGGAAYAVSAKLKAGDIAEGGKSATFTFELTNPQDGEVWLTYPASMLNEFGAVKSGVLDLQDGTLDNVSRLDLSSCKCTMTDATITSATLENRMAVMEYTLKSSDGTEDITSTITQLTVYDGQNTYTVNREAGAGPIYVVMYPVKNADIEYNATAGTKSYTKSVTEKTYNSGYIYPLSLRMMPAGALNGQFSVSSTDKVYFSKGNLQYDGTNWKFAASQWEVLGANGTGANGTATNYPMDLFTWGFMSNPAFNGSTYVGGTENLKDDTDWGHVMGEGWYTLSKDEWVYLFTNRSGAANKYGFATVNGVHGIIILPDGAFVDPNKNKGSSAFVGSTTGNDWGANEYTDANWTLMESAGCVFLPAAGMRSNSSVDYVGDGALYWSSTADGQNYACYVTFGSGYLNAGNGNDRGSGCPVRLVRQVK